MSTVKISQLPLLSIVNANTAQTWFVGVDVPTLATGKFTAHTLAQGLYANEILNVGVNPVLYSNVIGQFSGDDPGYLQINLQNFNANGSSDYVASTSDSDNANSYIDMGISGKSYNDTVTYGAFKPYDGYLYVHGPSHISNQGNLIIGTASSDANVMLMIGGTQPNNIMGWITKNSITLNTQSYITFADGTRQTTAGATNDYSIAAFAQANSASANTVISLGVNTTQNSRITIIEDTNVSQNVRLNYSNSAITIIEGVNTSQNTNITATDGKMQSAYNKANNALANTSGTFAGDLTLTGNLLTQGIISSNNSSFNENSPFIKITASNNYVTVAPSNTNYMMQITGKANSVTRVVLDSFGQNTYPVVVGRMGRGSADAPAATQNNDVMMRIVGNGYTGTQFPSSSPTKIDFVAAENITDLARGTQIQFWNTPIGSNAIQKIATFNADSVTFTGTVNPTKGFIYTPTVYPAAQTAITIDIANNSVVRAQTAAGLVVTLSNLLAGKEVVVWITNTAGNGQTFTHGLSAINSTINSTTYSIPATSTILARYMCIDATTQNTFVAVTHA